MNQNELKKRFNITQWSSVGINFWGVPKCANTSLKYALLKANNITVPFDPSGVYKRLHSPQYCYYISPDYALTNSLTNVTVIRHPYERVISLYTDFGQKRTQFFRESYTGISMSEFLNRIILCSDDTVNTNIHLRSISSFLVRDNVILPDIIYSIDSVPCLFKRFGLDTTYINQNTSADTTSGLTPTEKQCVYEHYCQDFIMFGFNR